MCSPSWRRAAGLYGPTLFDGYRDFTPRPAAFFALGVVRRPSADPCDHAFGGGYIASGPAGSSRVPRPYWPRGLKLLGTEGAGEVQTPLRGRAASDLRLGDRVWFRHAKAGEYCERFNELHLLRRERSSRRCRRIEVKGRTSDDAISRRDGRAHAALVELVGNRDMGVGAGHRPVRMLPAYSRLSRMRAAIVSMSALSAAGTPSPEPLSPMACN